MTESFWLPTTPEDENVPHLPIPKSHWEKSLQEEEDTIKDKRPANIRDNKMARDRGKNITKGD